MTGKNNKILLSILIFLTIISFIYRIKGLDDNYSFWSDEAHTALFVRAIFEQGKPVLTNGYTTNPYQLFQYWLSFLTSKIFGLNEFGIRFPSILFGLSTVALTYFLGKKIFNKTTALLSVFLTVFLNIEILWSRQARPYQALQFFNLLSFYLAVSKIPKKEILLLLVAVIGFLFHPLGLVIPLSGFLFLFLSDKLWRKWFYLSSFFLLSGIILVLYPSLKINLSFIGKFNNFPYYSHFMLSNYPSFLFLSFLGIISLFKKEKIIKLRLLLFFLGSYLFLIFFAVNQPFIRYFYPIFSFFILLSSCGLISTADYFIEIIKIKNRVIAKFFYSLPILFLILLLYENNKLTLLPITVYSLNEDMMEIPEVDWKNIYGFVEGKLKENTILVTNWNDLPVWYLGEGKLNYLVRNENYQVDPISGATKIDHLSNFKDSIRNNQTGIVVIDSWDNKIPDGIREYCHQNLKRELEVDRLYPVQPRYWTVWVYSWGI